jgi:hypothetical protein
MAQATKKQETKKLFCASLEMRFCLWLMQEVQGAKGWMQTLDGLGAQ